MLINTRDEIISHNDFYVAGQHSHRLDLLSFLLYTDLKHCDYDPRSFGGSWSVILEGVTCRLYSYIMHTSNKPADVPASSLYNACKPCVALSYAYAVQKEDEQVGSRNSIKNKNMQFAQVKRTGFTRSYMHL